jgi:hypothetical protein
MVTIRAIVPSLDVWRARFAGQLTTAAAARLINLFDRYSLEKTVSFRRQAGITSRSSSLHRIEDFDRFGHER